MSDPYVLVMLAYKSFSLTSNDIKENIQTLIYSLKTPVVQSKSMQYHK